MKQDLENLDLKFWSWLPKGIKNPKKINNFLNQRSELLDQEIIKKFIGPINKEIVKEIKLIIK